MNMDRDDEIIEALIRILEARPDKEPPVLLDSYPCNITLKDGESIVITYKVKDGTRKIVNAEKEV